MKEYCSFSTPLFRSMKDLSKEVKQMKRERKKEYLRRIFDEEGLSTSYQQKREPENHISPHRSTIPNFSEEGEWYRNKGKKEPETHETLSLYLEEYKE